MRRAIPKNLPAYSLSSRVQALGPTSKPCVRQTPVMREKVKHVGWNSPCLRRRTVSALGESYRGSDKA